MTRGAVSAAALFVLVAACGQPNPTDAVSDFEAVFPTLESYGVTNFYRTDQCEYIVYSRGAFVTDPDSEACEIDVDGPYPRSVIDAQARADLDAIYADSNQHGSKLQAAFPDYGPAGEIIGGFFGFEVCTSYIYDPGWTQLPTADSSTIAAVNADWYTDKCASAL